MPSSFQTTFSLSLSFSFSLFYLFYLSDAFRLLQVCFGGFFRWLLLLRPTSRAIGGWTGLSSPAGSQRLLAHLQHRFCQYRKRRGPLRPADCTRLWCLTTLVYLSTVAQCVGALWENANSIQVIHSFKGLFISCKQHAYVIWPAASRSITRAIDTKSVRGLMYRSQQKQASAEGWNAVHSRKEEEKKISYCEVFNMLQAVSVKLKLKWGLGFLHTFMWSLQGRCFSTQTGRVQQ